LRKAFFGISGPGEKSSGGSAPTLNYRLTEIGCRQQPDGTTGFVEERLDEMWQQSKTLDDDTGLAWCLSLYLTPKALANFSPGLARSDNPGAVSLSRLRALLIVNPGFLCSNPGLKLANAFGVKFKPKHYPGSRGRLSKSSMIKLKPSSTALSAVFSYHLDIMDYDSTDIPVGYDRGRDHGPEVLELWMNVVASRVGKQRLNTILDLGCGTGRFSESLAARFDTEVVGIDPSEKMLDQARRKLSDQRVRYQSGCAEAIPLPDDSVDLIFMSMSFHHFNDQTLAARECRRVLRNGGSALLRTGTRDHIPFYPYLGFFPKSQPIMEACLPTAVFVREVFESAGFSTVSSEVVIQTIAPDYATYAETLAAGADSVLAQLSPTDFRNGIEAMRAHGDDKPVSEPIDLFVFRK
jgi:ubiquinone/menaquinone biosynthesis C-methylase UbiE